MTLADVRAPPKPSVLGMIIDAVQRVGRESDQPAAIVEAENVETVCTVARDKRRLRAAVAAWRDGLAEQVIRMLGEGIESPRQAAIDEIRSNLASMGPGQLQGMMLTITHRRVFVALDNIETDVIGMLRAKLRG